MPDVDLRIRDAKLSDASALALLISELGYATTPEEMKLRLRSILGTPAYKTLVAEVDGEVRGMIGTLFQPGYEQNDLGGRICALVVSRRTRRRGIGRALIAAAEKDFAEKGVKRIALTTRLARTEAHRFYETLGYERNGWRFVKELPPTV